MHHGTNNSQWNVQFNVFVILLGISPMNLFPRILRYYTDDPRHIEANIWKHVGPSVTAQIVAIANEPNQISMVR